MRHVPCPLPALGRASHFRDGAAHYLDSPVTLFDFLRKISCYDRRYTLDDVAVSYVRDLESGQWVKTGQAFFVHGSEVTGPMRNADLPAFVSRSAADTFVDRHRGTVLTAPDMTPHLLASLNQISRHRH